MVDVEYVKVDKRGRITIPDAILDVLEIKRPGIVKFRRKDELGEVLLEGVD